MRFESAIASAIVLMMLCARRRSRAADPPTAPAKAANAPKALDLRIGNVRNYMMPNEFRAALTAPDSEKDTVIVEGERVLLPMKSLQPVPNSDHRAVLGARASAAGVEGLSCRTPIARQPGNPTSYPRRSFAGARKSGGAGEGFRELRNCLRMTHTEIHRNPEIPPRHHSITICVDRIAQLGRGLARGLGEVGARARVQDCA